MMNRFPAVLSVLGIALSLVGLLMMLRLLLGPNGGGLVDPTSQKDVEVLRAASEGDLISIYAFAMACGAAMFCAGLTMLLGRARFH